MLVGLSYSAEENLRRIAMDSNTKYILVEGEDDVPLYDNSLQNLLKEDDCEYVVLHGGGKSPIIEFIDNNDVNNTFVIFDRDFDFDLSLKFSNHIMLDKYSVENYLFDINVIAPCLAVILKTRIADIKNLFPITEWLASIRDKVKPLFILLYYYQKRFKGKKEEWSRLFLLDRGSENWELSNSIIKAIITKILATTKIKFNTARKFLLRNNLIVDNLEDVFPGKLLFESFYRFTYCNAENIKPRKFKSNYTNPEAYKNAISMNLNKSTAYVDKVKPVVSFITA